MAYLLGCGEPLVSQIANRWQCHSLGCKKFSISCVIHRWCGSSFSPFIFY